MASEVKQDPGGVRSWVRPGMSARKFFDLAERETARARELFPSSEGIFAALAEEVGELAQALLDKPWDQVVEEAMQVAAMAARVALEGDPTLSEVRERRARIREVELDRVVGLPGMGMGEDR